MWNLLHLSNNLPKYSPSGPQPDILLRFVFSIFLLDDACKNSENKSEN